MGKIDVLVQQLCPDGVKYLPIGQCLDYEQPTQYLVSSTTYDDSFETPVLTAGQTFILGYTDETDGVYYADTEHPVIIFDDFTTASQWVDFSFKAKSSAMKILKASNPNEYNLRYIYHCMQMLHYVPSDHVRHWISKYGLLEIPVPALPIQNEIVRILDTFAELQKELETELETELILRHKQYEYYRDKLLEFAGRDDIDWKPLSEIATSWERGSGIKREEVTSEGQPCIRYGEIYTTYGLHFKECVSHTSSEVITKPKIAKNGSVLFAITGESVEDIATSTAYLGDKDIYVGGDIVIMNHNQNAKYLAYALSTTNAKMQKSKGKIKSKVVHTKKDDISKIVIPVPKSLDEQVRIAEQLDKFYNLVTEIDESIPVEIMLRRQQYEYYRDKLLTFNRLEDNAV